MKQSRIPNSSEYVGDLKGLKQTRKGLIAQFETVKIIKDEICCHQRWKANYGHIWIKEFLFSTQKAMSTGSGRSKRLKST